jgi:hypothetical protein
VRIASLEQTDEQKRERWQQDLSRRVKNQATTVTYRPREANNTDENGAKTSFSQRAAAIRPKNSY